jgi:exopolysaccharide biosynthesis WecB/TagA/CpsF family protein
MENTSIRLINFYDLQLHSGTVNEFAQLIVRKSLVKNDALPIIISHVNIHNYYQLIRDQSFKKALQQNSYLIFDGIGLKIAAYIAGLGWLPDINGTDLFPFIMESGSKNQLRIFCLGANADVISKTVNKIRGRFPRIRMSGYRHGYIKPEEERSVVGEINASNADVLIIGMGFVIQEKFALTYRKELNVKVIWNVGGLFDIISENKVRTPLFMRNLRLEWLFRLFYEPQRTWSRIFISAPYFFVSFLIFRARRILHMVSNS